MRRSELNFINITALAGGAVALFFIAIIYTTSPPSLPQWFDTTMTILWPGSLGLMAIHHDLSPVVIGVIFFFLVFQNVVLYWLVAAFLVWARHRLTKVASHA
jgi:hypothetical protein